MVLFNIFSTSGHSTGKLSGEQRERLFLDSFVQLFGEEWIGVLTLYSEYAPITKKTPKLMHVADNQRIFKMSMEVHQIVQFMTLGLI